MRRGGSGGLAWLTFQAHMRIAVVVHQTKSSVLTRLRMVPQRGPAVGHVCLERPGLHLLQSSACSHSSDGVDLFWLKRFCLDLCVVSSPIAAGLAPSRVPAMQPTFASALVLLMLGGACASGLSIVDRRHHSTQGRPPFWEGEAPS